MIVDGWGLGRASLQAGLLPTRAGAPAVLPGNWAEEFHSASSLRRPELARAEPTLAGTSTHDPTRQQVVDLLAAAAQPQLDVVVLAHGVTGLRSGTYAIDPDQTLKTRAEIDPARFCRTVLSDGPGQTAAPAAVLAVVASVSSATDARGLRAYRHALIAAGRFGRSAEQAAAAMEVRAVVRADFVDDAANRQLGLLGTDRACVLVVALG